MRTTNENVNTDIPVNPRKRSTKVLVAGEDEIKAE